MDDNKFSLSDIKQGARKMTSSIENSKKVTDADSIPAPIGNAWMADAVKDLQEVPEISSEEILSKQEPIIPDDEEEYDGPGMVVETNEVTTGEEAKHLQAVTEPDGFKENVSKYLSEYDDRIEVAKQNYEEHVKSEKISDDDEEGTKDPNEMTTDEFNKKYEEAVIIIDKTGMGTVLNFTDEEHAKMEKVNKIKIEECETIALKTLKTKKPKKNVNLENIIERKQSLHSTNIVLLASGYTAVMKGCTPYELMEVILENNNEVVSQEMRWKLIYRKMESNSIGRMSFNEFLRNTAAMDYNTFLYGILCATYPDNDKFPLNCQNEKCKKQFDHSYSIRELIRAEKLTDNAKTNFMNIVDAGHTDIGAKSLHESSSLMQLKRFVLPVSEYIFDISVQSAYDFIYGSIQELKDNKEDKYTQAAIYSSIVRKLYIPDDDDEYFEFDKPMDITKVVYGLNATDLKILNKQAERLLEDISFEFGLMNVMCPYCKTVTNTVPIEVESVLFYKYQQEVNTKIV